MNLVALGRGVVGFVGVAAVDDAECADGARLDARMLKNLGDHGGGGGFALGARDGDGFQLAGGIAEQRGAHQCECEAGVVHPDDCHILGDVKAEVVADDEGGRALLHRRGGEFVAVGGVALQADKGSALCRLA